VHPRGKPAARLRPSNLIRVMPAKGESVDADVVIAGGGVIGTAIAWRGASAGLSVTLIDPDQDADKASLVAAGMLGPVSESVFGEHDLLALNLLSVGRFPGFNQELEDATGLTTGLRTEGTLAVAYDSGDLAALRRLTEFRHSIGLKAEALDARQCRALEPFLAPATRGGVLATGDLSVDNRRYLAALKAAAGNAGVKHLTGTVTEVAPGCVTARLGQHPQRDQERARLVGRQPQRAGDRLGLADGDHPVLVGQVDRAVRLGGLQLHAPGEIEVVDQLPLGHAEGGRGLGEADRLPADHVGDEREETAQSLGRGHHPRPAGRARRT